MLAMILLPNLGWAFAITNLGGREVKWKISEVEYWLDEDGWSGITDGSDLSRVHESFQDWQDVPCSFLRFRYAGSTTVSSVLPTGADPNGINEFVWSEDHWPFSQYVLGVASPLYGFDGVILEADIAMNGKRAWSSSGMGPQLMDVKSVAIHEIGHIFGLQHPLSYDSDDPPTMAPYVDPQGKSATLAEDDRNGICYLYPTAGFWPCASDAQCPWVVAHNDQGDEYTAAWYSCQDGTCVFDNPLYLPGQVGMGASCLEMSDCQVPLFCIGVAWNQFCTRWCSNSAFCGDGFSCDDVGLGSEGLCVSSSISGPGELGDPCFTRQDCLPGLRCQVWWTGSFCTQDCIDPEDGTGCPAGFSCMPVNGATADTGRCFPGNVADREVGVACTKSSQCISLLCFATPESAEMACRVPCTLPGGVACGPDAICVPAPWDPTGTHGGCVPRTSLPHKANGLTCAHHWQCSSGYCFFDVQAELWQCRTPCGVEGSQCSTSETCVFDGFGGGACLDQPDPPFEDGTPCTHDHQCAHLLCAELPGVTWRYCRRPCAGDEECSDPQQCIFYHSTEEGLCMDRLTPPGEQCWSSTECTTQICWQESGPAVCLLPCTMGQCPEHAHCHIESPYGPVCIPEPVSAADVVEDPSDVTSPGDDSRPGGVWWMVDADGEEPTKPPNWPAEPSQLGAFSRSGSSGCSAALTMSSPGGTPRALFWMLGMLWTSCVILRRMRRTSRRKFE